MNRSGWADDAGNAEVVSASVVVSRSGMKPPAPHNPRWSPSVLGIAEALLDGTPATVEAIARATDLSTGAATKGLGTLTDLGHLERDAPRGRHSARRVGDPRRLLDAYASQARLRPPKFSVETGIVWRDPISGATELAGKLDAVGTVAAVTGALAAAALAPFSMTIAPLVMSVDVDTSAELQGVCRDVGLRVVDGGRLRLAPFPTPCTSALVDSVDGLPVVPWLVAQSGSPIALERDHLPPQTFGVEDAGEHSFGSRRRQPDRGTQQSRRSHGFEVRQIQLSMTP